MSDGPDLFASAEPKTCGTCGSYQAELSHPERHYCDLSLKDALASCPGCPRHHPGMAKP